MQFEENKPIYIQIADAICDRVLGGEIKEGGRIGSVREFGADIGVNPNTVARSYDLLTERGVIYNKRGIGFYVCEGAAARIREELKRSFIKDEWPSIVRKAELLDINLKEII